MDSSAASSYSELVELGHVPGIESPHVLAYVDPIEKATEREKTEDPKGIEVRNHPRVLLNQDPDLWSMIDRFRCGVKKELSHDEFDSFSAWQIEAWVVMLGASNREELREVKRTRASHGE